MADPSIAHSVEYLLIDVLLRASDTVAVAETLSHSELRGVLDYLPILADCDEDERRVYLAVEQVLDAWDDLYSE